MYFPSIFYSMAGLLEDKLTGVMSRSAAAGETMPSCIALLCVDPPLRTASRLRLNSNLQA